ncbi:MAG TPA: metallopeptidase family protein [Candidatus Deferrimicrobiaceae bacterium]|nr:metallopeptidase family protein [Candidatus Deferrimicrobiaceae bacterium]
MGRAAFEKVLRQAIDDLPRRFREALRNVAIVVEDFPPDWLLEELDVPPGETLYGFYHGIPLPERSVQDSGNLPDKISLYRGPLEEDFRDPGMLARQIRVTLLHEIAHYFGMGEEDLSRLGYE